MAKTAKKTNGLKLFRNIGNTPAAETTNPDAPAKKASGKATAEKATKPAKEKQLSALSAAAQILAKAKEPMNCQDLIAKMAEQKLWTSPGGKTPNATLYAAILREINAKGKDARFKKTEAGKFAAK